MAYRVGSWRGQSSGGDLLRGDRRSTAGGTQGSRRARYRLGHRQFRRRGRRGLRSGGSHSHGAAGQTRAGLCCGTCALRRLCAGLPGRPDHPAAHRRCRQHRRACDPQRHERRARPEGHCRHPDPCRFAQDRRQSLAAAARGGPRADRRRARGLSASSSPKPSPKAGAAVSIPNRLSPPRRRCFAARRRFLPVSPTRSPIPSPPSALSPPPGAAFPPKKERVR